MTHDRYDVVIVGGATSGSSIAWHLADSPDFDGSVLVVEKDASLERSATIASNNCMRQQFATEINVRISQYAAEFVNRFRERLGEDVPELPIRNFGYLYLADTPEFADTLRADQALQAACGAGTHILTPEQIAQHFPFYELSDILAGSLNTVDEGAFDAFWMVLWLRQKARDHGVDYIENEVTVIERVNGRIASVALASGERIGAGCVIDAAGTRAADVSALAGVELPIEPRRRYTYIFTAERPLDQDLPLTIDPSGVHMRSFGARDYLVGCPPKDGDPAVDADDFSYEPAVWEDKVRPVIEHRIPASAHSPSPTRGSGTTSSTPSIATPSSARTPRFPTCCSAPGSPGTAASRRPRAGAPWPS